MLHSLLISTNIVVCTTFANDESQRMGSAAWSVVAPAIGSAFLASLVEVVEAFPIILAVGTLRGWWPAVFGTIGGLGVLGGLIVLLGPLLNRVPLHLLQFVVGVLLLLFGM